MTDADSTEIPRLRGVVLAGGLSRRMGRDKAELTLAGKSQLERAVSALSAQLELVNVSVRTSQALDAVRQGYDLIIDHYDDIGPAAGILSAHLSDPAAAWLVVACDMPLVDQAVVAALIEQRDPSKCATAFRNPHDGLPEPLCTIYEPGTLARFRQLAEQGAETSPRAILIESEVRLLGLPQPHALDNINTPEDLARISELLK